MPQLPRLPGFGQKKGQVDSASRLASTGNRNAACSLSIAGPSRTAVHRRLSLLALARAGAPVSQFGLGIEDFDSVLIRRRVLV
jgi:hypothetical protein